MKHFVKGYLLLSMILLAAGSTQAQSVATVTGPRAKVKLQPQLLGTAPSRTASSTADPSFKGMSPQGVVQSLSYYQDTTDNFFSREGGIDSFNVALTPGSPDSVAFYSWGYAERFTTSLNKAYLDSVQILLGIISMPTTNSLTFTVAHERQDTIRDKSGNILYYLPGVDLHNTAITSAKVSGADVEQQALQTLTVNFKHKLLGTKDHSFWVSTDMGGTTPYEDSVIFCFDANVQDERDIDSTIDRCNVVTQDAAHQYFIEYSLAGNFSQVADPTQHLYQNMVMIAYLDDGTTGAVESSAQPSQYRLAQNYPNPFNPTTDIAYAIQAQSQVSLKVYNALGQEVATLVNQLQKAGEHSVTFDASSLPSGTYFYTLRAGLFSETKRMILSK